MREGDVKGSKKKRRRDWSIRAWHIPTRYPAKVNWWSAADVWQSDIMNTPSLHAYSSEYFPTEAPGLKDSVLKLIRE